MYIDHMNVIGNGDASGILTDRQIRQIIADACAAMDLDGKRVLVIIPDHTRTCPLPLVSRLLYEQIAPRARTLDFMVALGTHPPLSARQIDKLLGMEGKAIGDVFGKTRVFNHQWNEPSALAPIGKLSADTISGLTGGRFTMDVDVTVNRRIFDYDVLLAAGPVFPHEVAGFSGGSKYFFPGISGPEVLNFFHWLGAVITNPRIIGAADTPVRQVIEAAADMIDRTKYAFCMVVGPQGLHGLYAGAVGSGTGILPVIGAEHGQDGHVTSRCEAWRKAADLSNKIHVTYLDEPVESVLAAAPPMYDDLWVGGKCMYKLEPVVADGGELIIYAPHIAEISVTHGRLLEQIGYHTRDYFLAQWDRFKHYPWGVLAHSTHVRGIGTYKDGVERPRVNVTLATGIPRELCERINLGYRDPASIDVSQWRDTPGRLCVAKAGEQLYKLRNLPQWQRP